MQFSVIVPVLNEEKKLSDTISHLRKTTGQAPIEIIVVDGQSKDNSFAIAQKLADQALIASHPGRAFQMHEGAKIAKGNLLLFLHADTQLPDHWQTALANAWNGKEKPIATAFELGFDQQGHYYKTMGRAARLRYLLTGVPHGDQAIAMLRKTYFSIGGFPDVPLMEEYYLFQKLKKLGKTKILDATVLTSSRRYEKYPLRNNLKNNFLILLHYLGVSPKILASLYRPSQHA